MRWKVEKMLANVIILKRSNVPAMLMEVNQIPVIVKELVLARKM